MTWAHLEKKRTRLRTYTKSLEDMCFQCVETLSQFSSEGVTTIMTASELLRRRQDVADLKKP